DQGVGVIAYNPLAGGFLTGKYRGQTAAARPESGRFALGKTGELYRDRYWQHAQFEAVEHLAAFFQARGKSLVRVAVAWVLAPPGVPAAAVGAGRAGRLGGGRAAVDLTLDAEEKEACDLAWYALPRRGMTR